LVEDGLIKPAPVFKTKRCEAGYKLVGREKIAGGDEK
jgi:hypothetical protein